MSSSVLVPAPVAEVTGDTEQPAALSEEPATPKGAAVSDLADSLGRTMRAMQRIKAQFLAQDRNVGTDWSAHVVLARIVMDGPQRITALADVTQCDASTVSRQVAGMVKDGLLARQADPGDGRASLIVATDAGRAAVATSRNHRNREFEAMLADWSIADTASLAALLARFADHLQVHTPATSTATPGVAASRKEN